MLSKNFSLEELIYSDTALRYKISNKPGAKEIEALTLLCNKVLQPVRDKYARAVIVTSGYRSPALNRHPRVGGVANSQHEKGEAVDFKINGVSHYDVCKWMEATLNYDQLIYEYGEGGWIHVSYREPYRNQELSKISGRKGYPSGIIRN